MEFVLGDWDDDWGRVRNLICDEAARRGADWILNLDADDAVRSSRFDLRSFLEHTTSSCVRLIYHYEEETADQAAWTYIRERLWRPQLGARFVGTIHEELLLGGSPVEGPTLREPVIDHIPARTWTDRIEHYIQVIRREVADHGETAKMLYEIGCYQLHHQQYADADQTFNRALSMATGSEVRHRHAIAQTAVLNCLLNDVDGPCRQYAECMIETRPLASESYAALGATYARDGLVSDAIAMLAKAVGIEDSDPYAMRRAELSGAPIRSMLRDLQGGR